MFTGITKKNKLNQRFALALLMITGTNVYLFDVFSPTAGVENNLQFQEKW
jgi:hypothetical protein